MVDNFAKITDPVNPQSYDNKTVGWLPGIVIDNNDPERLGRVRVICPIIDRYNPMPNDNDGWIPRITTYTTNEQPGGTVYPIDVGTQVVMISMMGDLKQLVVLGCLHSRSDRPFIGFDVNNDVTGTVHKSGRIVLHDDSDLGKGTEVKMYPSGTVEKVDADGNKTLETPEGALLQLDANGGVRLENNKGFFSVSKEGIIEQANDGDVSISMGIDGKISLNTPTSPKLTLSSSGVDLKAQKDDLSDIKQGLLQSYSGAFAGTFNTLESLKGLKMSIANGDAVEYILFRYDEILRNSELNFDEFKKGNDFMDRLLAVDPNILGERAVAQMDQYRELGLDKVKEAIDSTGGEIEDGETLASIIEGAIPGELLGIINIDADFLDKIVKGNYGDLESIVQGVLGGLVPGGDITDIETMFSLGIASILGELGLSRTMTDIMTKVVKDGSFELSDIGTIIGELGIAQDLFNEIGGFLTGAFDFVFNGLDQALGYLDTATEFINNIDQMIIDFIGFPIPFGLDAIFSYLGQVTGILDKAKGFIDEIKGKVEQIEGLIGQFIDLKNDETLANNFGNEVLNTANNLQSIATGQQDLDPMFTVGRKFSKLLIELETIDTVEELPSLEPIIAEMEAEGYSMNSLKNKVLNPEKLLGVQDTKVAINDFLVDFVNTELNPIIDKMIGKMNEGKLRQGNKLLLETTDKIAFLQGATFKGNADRLTTSASSYETGGLMQLDKDLVSMMGPGGKRGFGPAFSLDGEKSILKTAGADLGLGMFMEMGQENLKFASPGAQQGLGSTIEMEQKKITLKGPGAKNSIGSFVELDLEQAKIYSPGGDKGLGSNIVADVGFLRLNGPGESNKSKNNSHINIDSGKVKMYAPGGANITGSEFVMDSKSVHCRAGSDLPIDMRARLSMTPFESSLFAPYETVLINSYLMMNRLGTDLNGGMLSGPNGNLFLSPVVSVLSKREGLLEQSAVRLTDISIDCHAGLPGVGPSYVMAPTIFQLNNGPGGAFTNMVANTWHAAVTGGTGIFMVGPLIFIN